MGCDIHTTLADVRRPGGNLNGWQVELAANVLRERNYRLFALLAGERMGEPVEFIPPRGFPSWWEGSSLQSNERGAGAGEHTPSWLTIAELRAVAKRYQPYPHETGVGADRTKRAIEAICDYAEAYAAGEPILVFSFDS